MNRSEMKLAAAVAVGIATGFAVLAWLYFGFAAG